MGQYGSEGEKGHDVNKGPTHSDTDAIQQVF